MKRNSPFRRRSGLINKINAARRSKRFKRYYHSEAYVVAVKATPCCVCGRRPTHSHHLRSKAAGGTVKDLVPLCERHHSEFHNTGTRTFQTKHDIDLTEHAEALYTRLAPLRS